MNDIERFFMDQNEPLKGYLLFLRQCILSMDKEITESWKYSMPFYHIRGRRFAFLWIQKKDRWPYIGIVDGNKLEHPALHTGTRKRMKILLLDPGKDVPVKRIRSVLSMVLALYPETATAAGRRRGRTIPR